MVRHSGIVRVLLLAVLLLALALITRVAVPDASAQMDDLYDCGDFDAQEEAQAEYDRDPSDPYGLDGPPGEAFAGEQGVACEDLPSGGTSNGDSADASDDQYGNEDPDATPAPTGDAGGELLEAGGSVAGPVPTMQDGGCPKEFPKKEGVACYRS